MLARKLSRFFVLAVCYFLVGGCTPKDTLVVHNNTGTLLTIEVPSNSGSTQWIKLNDVEAGATVTFHGQFVNTETVTRLGLFDDKDKFLRKINRSEVSYRGQGCNGVDIFDVDITSATQTSVAQVTTK